MVTADLRELGRRSTLSHLWERVASPSEPGEGLPRRYRPESSIQDPYLLAPSS
jgi:hypothetical protein